MTQPIAEPQVFESPLNTKELAVLKDEIAHLSFFLQDTSYRPYGKSLKEHLDYYLPLFKAEPYDELFGGPTPEQPSQ